MFKIFKYFNIKGKCGTGTYLKRWQIETRWFSIKLHKFLRSDEDEDQHDHPWDFITFILKGGYWEEMPDKSQVWRKPFTIHYREATHKHRVILGTKPSWSLVVTGPRIRSWGFHTPQGWVYWKDYLNSGNTENC